MDIKLFNDDIEKLRPISESWLNDSLDNPFGLKMDIENHLQDLKSMASNNMSTVLALYDGEKPVGYMALRIFDSPTTGSKIANEHFWYVLPDNRKIGSIKMIKIAKMWAKLNGCSHIIFTASNAASKVHDKLCDLYEKLGFMKLETQFIQEL
ncbi:MAG: GNAT family N-acetyltransferase [Thermoplasmata archaeon]|nr:GNAT family N-acetyltransferase [Thermoplasmata archaeon]